MFARMALIHKSMSLKYEPSSEPQETAAPALHMDARMARMLTEPGAKVYEP